MNETPQCPVCRSKPYSVLTEKQAVHPLWWKRGKPHALALRYVLCDTCGYIRLFPHLTAEEYDEVYRSTPGLDKAILSAERSAMLARRKDFILKHATTLYHGRMIEAGPAHGDFLWLFDSFKTRIGIEPSETYCASVQKERPQLTYYPTIVEAFHRTVSGMKNSADLVAACHVLEHAFDPQNFVNELEKLLKRDGYLFLEVPSIEGMAVTPNPLYLNLYYGHVSQFSVSVVTRIGVQAGLTPITVQVGTEAEYPVIRALFQKRQGIGDIRQAFLTHLRNIEDGLSQSFKICKQILTDPAFENILIWGCGQDLLDVLTGFDDEQFEVIRTKIKLADRNKNKQGLRFRKCEICDPDVYKNEAIDVIIIPSRSQLLRIDIGNDAKVLFPKVKQIFPFQQPSEIG